MRVTTSNPKYLWEGELGVECVLCGLRTSAAMGTGYMTADSTSILKSYSNIRIQNCGIEYSTRDVYSIMPVLVRIYIYIYLEGI